MNRQPVLVLWQVRPLHCCLSLTSSKKSWPATNRGTNGVPGAEDNFVDSKLVRQLGIPTEPLEAPFEATHWSKINSSPSQNRSSTQGQSQTGQIQWVGHASVTSAEKDAVTHTPE